MKNRNLILILGATAFAALAINAAASNALLSPRATGNQIQRVAGTVNDAKPVAPSATAVSPRAAGNQVKTVVGASSAVNPATQCARNMTASPKAIQACAANPANMTCCSVAAAK